jgi:hypothetical protein
LDRNNSPHEHIPKINRINLSCNHVSSLGEIYINAWDHLKKTKKDVMKMLKLNKKDITTQNTAKQDFKSLAENLLEYEEVKQITSAIDVIIIDESYKDTEQQSNYSALKWSGANFLSDTLQPFSKDIKKLHKKKTALD